MPDPFLRLQATIALRARSVDAHYKDIKSGLMTKPVRIGAQAVAWPESEVVAVNAYRMAGKTDDEIRDLVKRLHAKRQAVAERVLEAA